MKFTFLVALLACALGAQAQAQRSVVPAPGLPADSLTGRIKFQGVVAVPGVPAAELHARAREWVALTFQDAHQVTQLDDAARGVLILRGYTTTWVDVKAKRPVGTTPLLFTCRLDFRDGRYRYEVFDLGGPLGSAPPVTLLWKLPLVWPVGRPMKPQLGCWAARPPWLLALASTSTNPTWKRTRKTTT